MDLKIEGRNVDVGRRLQAHVSRKMDHIARHLPAATGARVEVTLEPTRSRQEGYLVQISLNIKGTVVRAESRGPSAIAALNAAAARLDQLAARFKGQVYRSQRAHASWSLAEFQAAEAFEEDRELARQFLSDEESETALTL